MKFKISRASSPYRSDSSARKARPIARKNAVWDSSLKSWTIEISNLDELMELTDYGDPIIIDVNSTGPEITIYDDRVE